jgi:hypothetical protein
MNELAVVDKGADWRRLKALVLDSVSSPITKRPGIAERATGPPRRPLCRFFTPIVARHSTLTMN